MLIVLVKPPDNPKGPKSPNIRASIRTGSTAQLFGVFFGKGECSVSNGIAGQFLNSAGCLSGTQKDDNLVDEFNQNCINGGAGNDGLSGGPGNDKLNGDDGNDKLKGGDGKDILVGGNGNDGLSGGKGADLFQCGAGNDKITDFKPSEGDKKTNDCELF
jgi:Ca2+-binding RTX toxin-like protein